MFECHPEAAMNDEYDGLAVVRRIASTYKQGKNSKQTSHVRMKSESGHFFVLS